MRTTTDEVRQIMDETELTDAVITSYITGANLLVTQTVGSTGLPSGLLTEIERWLTAHMIASTRERQAVKEEAGGAKIEYAGVYGEGLKSTTYGQMVLALDTSGSFAALGGKGMSIRAVEA